MKTDLQLQQDVMAELRWEPAVNAALIGVEVRDGVVTLAGEVGSHTEKLNAELAAQRVAGVQALAVDLKVTLPTLVDRTDTDIARAAKDVLSWTDSVPANAIHVLVEDGWITLSGRVEWQFQRQAAAGSVRYLSGVTGISNQIAIEPVLRAHGVRAEIEAAIKRRAVNGAKTVLVNVKGGDVTLSGSVRSWAERDLVNRSAWGSPGVRQVIDHMRIV